MLCCAHYGYLWTIINVCRREDLRSIWRGLQLPSIGCLTSSVGYLHHDQVLVPTSLGSLSQSSYLSGIGLNTLWLMMKHERLSSRDWSKLTTKSELTSPFQLDSWVRFYSVSTFSLSVLTKVNTVVLSSASDWVGLLENASYQHGIHRAA